MVSNYRYLIWDCVQSEGKVIRALVYFADDPLQKSRGSSWERFEKIRCEGYWSILFIGVEDCCSGHAGDLKERIGLEVESSRVLVDVENSSRLLGIDSSILALLWYNIDLRHFEADDSPWRDILDLLELISGQNKLSLRDAHSNYCTCKLNEIWVLNCCEQETILDRK